MSNIFLYAHGGSGNHGCEAIVRSTLGLLDDISFDNIILLSSNPAEDNKYQIDKLCHIINEKGSYSKLSFDFTFNNDYTNKSMDTFVEVVYNQIMKENA